MGPDAEENQKDCLKQDFFEEDVQKGDEMVRMTCKLKEQQL